MLMAESRSSSVKQTASKRQAADGVTKADSKRDKKKEKKGSTLLLILIVIILTTIVSFGAIFLFNFAGLRTVTAQWISNIPVIGNLAKPALENKTPEQLEWEAIEKEKASNAVALKEVNEQKKELEQRYKELESKERELEEKQLQIDEMLKKLSTKLNGVQEQVEYLEKVDNAKAVQIILNLEDKESAVQILRNMKKEKASAILSLMDPLQAAQILEDIAK
jgi:flagellar motility protein MotE (MotC chaperone)